jgi:hypothetical protein
MENSAAFAQNPRAEGHDALATAREVVGTIVNFLGLPRRLVLRALSLLASGRGDAFVTAES